MVYFIVCIRVLTPLKNTTPSFLPSSPLNQQTVQAPLFRQSPLCIGFSWAPLKVWFFSEPQKYQNFPVWILSYDREKYFCWPTIFVNKYFRFYFLCENCDPPEKSHPLLSKQPPSKSWGLVKPPFLKIWLEAQPPSPPAPFRKERCTLCILIFGLSIWVKWYNIFTSNG